MSFFYDFYNLWNKFTKNNTIYVYRVKFHEQTILTNCFPSLSLHYSSIQRTLLKHPLRQGFLMTPGYPKYYIGNSVCRWTLYAKRSQKIKLTILDLALRCKWNSLAKIAQIVKYLTKFCFSLSLSRIAVDEPCRDYLEIRDLNTNQTLFSGCTESTRPIEVVSLQDRVEVRVFCEADGVIGRELNGSLIFLVLPNTGQSANCNAGCISKARRADTLLRWEFT